jgi:transcription initiation factor TFIID subunit 6
VHWTAEQDVDLTEAFQAPLPSAPLAPTYSKHWLAVDGVQPDIAQNPPKRKSNQQQSTLSMHADHKSEGSGGGGDNGQAIVSHVLSYEMQLLFGKVTEAMRCGVESQQKSVFASLAADSGLQELMPYFSQFIQAQVCYIYIYIYACVYIYIWMCYFLLPA